MLKTALKTRLTNDYRLLLQCGETRSQHRNKELLIERFIEVITAGLIEKKERKATKKPKAAIRKRLDNKRLLSQKKAQRKKPDID